MARANRRRLFRLPRRADQQPGAERVSIPRPRSLASAVMSAQPKSTSAMDAHDETGRRVPPPAASPASLAECALRRQTPEVGAECPNWARSDLCGGRSAMGVPTANTALPALAEQSLLARAEIWCECRISTPSGPLAQDIICWVFRDKRLLPD